MHNIKKRQMYSALILYKKVSGIAGVMVSKNCLPKIGNLQKKCNYLSGQFVSNCHLFTKRDKFDQ